MHSSATISHALRSALSSRRDGHRAALTAAAKVTAIAVVSGCGSRSSEGTMATSTYDRPELEGGGRTAQVAAGARLDGPAGTKEIERGGRIHGACRSACGALDTRCCVEHVNAHYEGLQEAADGGPVGGGWGEPVPDLPETVSVCCAHVYEAYMDEIFQRADGGAPTQGIGRANFACCDMEGWPRGPACTPWGPPVPPAMPPSVPSHEREARS